MLLNQPYPVSEKTPRQIFLTGFLAGAFVALFLIIFQPFGTSGTEFPYKTLFLAGYGVIVAVVVWLATLLPKQLFDDDQWTVWKQVMLMLVMVLGGLTASYYYLHLLGGSPSWHSYGFFVMNSMTVAIFPVVGITLADYVIKLKRYSKGAADFNARPVAASESAFPAAPQEPSVAPAAAPSALSSIKAEGTAAELVISDDQDRPVVTLATDRIWCLRSDRNYVDFFHLDAEGLPAKTTIRNTLTKVSINLPAGFLRCHRSYFVRAAAVDSVTGNAQGYQLHNPDFPEMAVPVSRGKSSEILGIIQG